MNCFKIIKELNVKKIIFSTDNDFEIWKTMDYNATHTSHGNRYLSSIR
jgi:hypothetical protein